MSKKLWDVIIVGGGPAGISAALRLGREDLDVLVVVDSDDWRIHKRVRYLAADTCLKYDLDLSPRVWSASHRREMEAINSLLLQNIQRDSINLLEISRVVG